MDNMFVKGLITLKSWTWLRVVCKPFMDLKYAILLKSYCKSEDSKKIRQLKNRFEGESCFIIGNGPSLTISDLEKLKNHYSFGVNKITSVFEESDWRPTFYSCVDVDICKLISKTIENLDIPYIFIDVPEKKYLHPKDDSKFYSLFIYTVFTKHRWDSPKPHISEDVSQYVMSGRTVTFINIQLAIYMGFKKIYLLGIDNTYSVAVNREGKVTKDDSIKNYGANIKDSGVSIQYVDTVNNAYNVAREYADSHGIEIYNCTRGGKLEAFPRMTLEDAIMRCEKQKLQESD